MNRESGLLSRGARMHKLVINASLTPILMISDDLLLIRDRLRSTYLCLAHGV